jgi:hypothetical protein
MDAPDPHDLLHVLIQIASHQLTITQDVRAVLHELRDFNKQQVALNERLEQMLQGVLPPSPNGH